MNTIISALSFTGIQEVLGIWLAIWTRWNNAKQAEERDRMKHTGPIY